MNPLLEVSERGQIKTFSFEEMLKYHGPDFPGGVAHAYKVLERALPLLAGGEPPERRDIHIRTAFRGPGARDGFELVTRAVTEDRYLVDPTLERADRGRTLERYVFILSHRGVAVTLTVREGFVVDEFIGLARKTSHTPQEQERLTVLKQEMADRLLARPAIEVYDVEE